MNYPKLIEKILEILISKGEWQTLPEGGRMIEDIIKQIRKAAMELGIEVDELLEWLRAENNKKLPWEE